MIHIAHKTLAAIREAIERDQGASFRAYLRNLMPLAEDAYREDNFPFRNHLGASIIGADCARALWYGFHWATQERQSDRMLRLFNRGHLEEPRFIAMLATAGIKTYQHASLGKQFQIALYGGHFGGSLDAVANLVPDCVGPVLCEFKTHDRKSFAKLAGSNWLEYVANPKSVAFTGEGVRASKFQHYVQMQMYMRAYQLEHGLYMSVCKDDDSLYAEIIALDESISNAYSSRAREIIFASEPPARIKNDPTWWLCKFCDHNQVCYGKAKPSRNCRTCAASLPSTTDNTWLCREHSVSLDKQAQFTGCNLYQIRKL